MLLFRKPLLFQAWSNQVQHQAYASCQSPTILGRQSISWLFLLHHEQLWWVVVCWCASGWHGGYQVLVHERRRQHRAQQGPVRHTGLLQASKPGPVLTSSALMSKRFVAYLASFLGDSFYLKTTNQRVFKVIDNNLMLCMTKFQRLGTVHNTLHGFCQKPKMMKTSR